MKRTLTIALPLLFACIRTMGQTPTIQDCLGAIPVCQPVYTESVSAQGSGNYPNEINTSISCTAGELNSIWYVFTAAQDGELGFVITPNNSNDDYDWTLFDITNATCQDISTNQNLQVSCNASGGGGCHGPTGATGATPYDEQGAGCGSNPPTQFNGFTPFNDLIPMEEGRTYVLMVSNWTGSTFGYKIDFSPSTGLGIFDQVSPEIDTIITPESCGQNTIDITFSEFILCSTINSANFQLTGPGGPYIVNLLSPNCIGGNNAHAKEFSLSVTPPISSMGNFTLQMTTNGTTQVLDLCDNPAASTSISFNVNTPIPVAINLGVDTSLLCNGDVLTIDATTPNSTYLWDDGSTNPTLPVTVAGNYAVTVTTPCGSGSDNMEIVTLFDVPQLNLGADQTLCTGETLPFDLEQPFASYTWQDGSTSPQYTISSAGTYAVTITNVCGVVQDQILVNYIPPVVLELGPRQVLCDGETLDLDVSHPNGTYQWQNGSSLPVFRIDSPGLYGVTVTTPCETQQDTLRVDYISPPQLALSNDTILCPWQTIQYDLTVEGATYQWQDGTTSPVYLIDRSGDYAVTVTHACGTFDAAVTVTILDSIRTELGRDTFYCPGEFVTLDASAGTLADYFWNDGSTSALLAVKGPGIYSVAVSNICEQVTDQVVVGECEYCDVYVPTGFSPNSDGINDDFRPLSDCPLDQYSLRIFDRWGAQLFETDDPGAGWDGEYKGKPVSAGVYVWWIEYTVVENNRPRKATETGGVAVVR
jgi:gliding motility-associated-like protein